MNRTSNFNRFYSKSRLLLSFLLVLLIGCVLLAVLGAMSKTFAARIASSQGAPSNSRLAANVPGTIAAGSSSRQWVWQNRLPQGNTLQDFSLIDVNNGFAVGARGSILKTTDGGHNWELITGETEDDLYAVSFH